MKLLQSLFRCRLAAIAAAIALILVAALAPTGDAATPNYALPYPVQIVPFEIAGQYTATTTAVVKFQLPFKAKLIGVSATARASGGSSPTLTVDVKQGSTSVLSAPISITAGTVSEGTVTTAQLTDESTISVNLAIGGSSPTWNDITVLLTIVRN